MNFFRRKPQVSSLPADISESWDAQAKQIVVHIPLDATGKDSSVIADTLSDSVIATVQAVQAGEFGHTIPEGVTGATVRVQVDTGTTALGELPNRTLDILRERVGKSMEITVHTEPLPEGTIVEEETPNESMIPQIPRTGANGEKLGLWASLKAAAEEQAAQVQAQQPALTPTEGLDPAFFTWDEENNALRAEIVLLAKENADRQTQTDINHLVEQTIASLGAPDTKALIPEGNKDYGIWLTVAVNDDAVGPLTRKKLEQGEDQFAGTRVDFVVMIEPRAAIEEMLAG
ncbi:hypothetical protein V5R04_09875 [Jonesiaceae bacterium BS-20]|uniref:Uncharacterized protein n=1 Tax=Jonesiaceae bacterium BS-20 TaxID=3120821 RepID=A0AAU7DRV4_9MICO